MDLRPTEDWLEPVKLHSIMREARESTEKQAVLNELRAALSSEFNRHFFDLPLRQWKVEFHTRYRGFFRFLSGDYRRSMKAIRSARSTDGKFTYWDALDRLHLGAEIQEHQMWFEQKRSYHETTFGYHFNGAST